MFFPDKVLFLYKSEEEEKVESTFHNTYTQLLLYIHKYLYAFVEIRLDVDTFSIFLHRKLVSFQLVSKNNETDILY